jgi:hypothetical protein
MKSFIFAAISLITLGCGNASQPNSGLTGLPALPPAELTGTVQVAEAEIASVVVHSAPAPASGIWTEVTLNFHLECGANLSNFAYDQRFDVSTGTVILIVSATEHVYNANQVCVIENVAQRTITLMGMYGADDVRVENLATEESPKVLPAKTIGIVSATGIVITSTHSLCPEGAMCITDGTVVNLLAHIGGCVDSAGPLSYHAVQPFHGGKMGALQLTVHIPVLVNEDSKVTRCFVANTKAYTLSLNMLFGDKDSIDLTIL